MMIERSGFEDPSVAFTYFGDANLDGEFNSSDFVQVFQARPVRNAAAGWLGPR